MPANFCRASRAEQDKVRHKKDNSGAFKLFAQYKDALLAGKMTPEDYDKQALASLLTGICISQGLTGVPHGLGYPLSHLKHVPHGLSCGIFEGEYLKIFKDKTKVMRAIDLMGFKSVDEFADYVQAILTPHIDIEVTEEELEQCDKERP